MSWKVAVCVLGCLVAVGLGQGQQGMTQCQNTFLQSINNCVQQSSLDFNNFLHLVTNGTNGQAPDNAASFKTDSCAKKEELIQCGMEFMRTLINSTMCAPNSGSTQDQRPIIDRQFRTIFGSLDEMCAHPCRRTLADDLRKCYTDAELDADLFLSNSTMERGAIIGATKAEAQDFCSHKDALVACMKQKRDECPESPMILRAIGLDIESMEKGVGVLCGHQDVYLSGIDCFAEATEAVIACQSTMAQKTMQLTVTSQQQNLPEDQFFNHFCDIRVEHVSCDLDSWAKKNHEACSANVIGLRTELECGLIPDNCAGTHKQQIDQVCHPENFKREMRPVTGAASSTSAVLSLVSTMAVLAHLLSAHPPKSLL